MFLIASWCSDWCGLRDHLEFTICLEKCVEWTDSEILGFLKTTDQPTTYHQPPTNWPTNHQPVKNLRTRNFITNFKWISDKKMWDRVINTISRMWVIIFLSKPECVTEKIKIKVRWWLHDPCLPGWNFTPSSRGRSHPTIACGNLIWSRQGGTVFHLALV